MAWLSDGVVDCSQVSMGFLYTGPVFCPNCIGRAGGAGLGLDPQAELSRQVSG